MSTDATKLENEMSIIRDPDDQTRQMKVGPSGQIYFEQQGGTSTIVSGQSAVGETPTANPVSVSGVDSEGKKRAIRTDADGRVQTVSRPAAANTFTITTTSDVFTYPVSPGDKIVALDITTDTALFNASLRVLYSVDSTNGVNGTFFTLSGRLNSTFAATFGTNIGQTSPSFRGDLPPKATYVRVICAALTTGPLSGIISTGDGVSSGAIAITNTVNTILGAGVARAGFMARPGTWTRESTTPVNASLTITGAAKTTYNTSSGTALNTATSYGDKFSAAAGADVAGTLVIDASPDSGTTWYPVTSVALAQVGGSGNFGAYLETPVCEATMRARLVNGGTNQARAYLTTRMLG